MSSHPSRSSIDPQSIGRFAVLSKLGEGGMGAVYLAEDPKLKRRVAIKTMRPEVAADARNRDRFEREARSVAAVEHESIVPVLEVGEAADGTPFIVMPYLKGEPLDVRLKREPVSPLWLLLKVAREVAEGLAAAHAAGLIHRDIKPANIWLDGDPSSPSPALQVKRCKILDFGLARSMSEDDIQLTKTGAVLGTPAYMAPEQAKGAKVDHRTDLYSLGATLYRMAAGELPFSAPNMGILLYALAKETPRSLCDLNPQMPQGVAAQIERLLQKSPDSRPRSAGDVALTFRRFDEREQSKTQPPTLALTLPSKPPTDESPVAQPSSESTRLKSKPRGAVRAEANREDPLPFDLNALTKEVDASGVLPVQQLNPHELKEAKDQKNDNQEPNTGSMSTSGYLAAALVFCVATIFLLAYIVIVALSSGLLMVAGSTPLIAALSILLRRYRYRWRVVAAIALVVALVAFWPSRPQDSASRQQDSERKAAEYVLSQNGSVKVDIRNQRIDNRSELPSEPFYVTECFPNAPVTDEILIKIKGLKRLQILDLREAQITNASLAYVCELKTLQELYLTRSSVDDKGLDVLHGCVFLKYLGLSYTKVTQSGVDRLAAALPQCSIRWDGGVIEPKK